jgi:hypothetical protein
MGLHQLMLSSGTTKLLAVENGASNSTLYSSDAGATWTSEATLTKDIKTRFLTFLDTVVFFNGTDSSQSSVDGTTWLSTGGDLDVGNFPKGNVAIEWNDKIYVSGVSGYYNRLYYSSTPSVGGAISWTSGNGYIDIEPEDGGGKITALSKIPGYLLIFKERSLKRWDGSSTYPDDLFSVGATSQEGVTQARGVCYFFSANGKGIYITNGGYPQLLSRPIQAIIDAIPTAYLTSISSYSDGNNVYFSIGDITLDSIVYNNAVLKYNIDSQNWSFYTLGVEPQMWTTYVVSGATYTIFGDDDSGVVVLNSGTTDGTTLLEYTYQTQELSFSDKIQEISRLVVHTRNAPSASVMARVDKGEWQPLGTVKKDTQLIENFYLRGTVFEFRISGESKEGLSEVSGLTFPDVNVTENY